MTEKEQFISEILALVKQPLAGSNPITPTEEQIALLQASKDTADAMQVAQNLGWTDYLVEWSLNKPVDEQENLQNALTLALQGDTNNYLGVDANTVVNRGGEVTTIGAYGENFYVNGDQNVFEASTPEEIREIQANLINAGLLGSKVNRPFRPGVWGKSDKEAMYDLMSQANQNGEGKAERGWETLMQVYLDNPIPEPTKVQAYLPPDYKSISNSVNNLFESELGRKPKPYELRLLADTYSVNAKKAYEQDVALETPQEQVAVAGELEDYGNHIQPVIEPGVTDIDPGARMKDVFDRVTQKEQERLGRNRDIQATNRIITNAITGGPR
tara:strand:- start:947 stop:1930 length:984 start_codon:yes stop_codon:yes gene_type:complete